MSKVETTSKPNRSVPAEFLSRRTGAGRGASSSCTTDHRTEGSSLDPSTGPLASNETDPGQAPTSQPSRLSVPTWRCYTEVHTGMKRANRKKKGDTSGSRVLLRTLINPPTQTTPSSVESHTGTGPGTL